IPPRNWHLTAERIELWDRRNGRAGRTAKGGHAIDQQSEGDDYSDSNPADNEHVFKGILPILAAQEQENLHSASPTSQRWWRVSGDPLRPNRLRSRGQSLTPACH